MTERCAVCGHALMDGDCDSCTFDREQEQAEERREEEE